MIRVGKAFGGLYLTVEVLRLHFQVNLGMWRKLISISFFRF
jgi:hypothetical protein